ncbi:hypothetical protein C8J57DRAFT_1327826 [Mycena rebaudengoi]|nr:hypothetical protein C8J57DRAFT_1327826 [Mycena rebaudengoi]
MDMDYDRHEDSDDSMPDLQSVSNSSDSESSDSEEEDRRQVAQEAVQDDDNDSTWTDVDEDMPPLEPTSGSRRPRVDDDQDQDRDRRHPSMRVNPPPPGAGAGAGAQPQPQPQPRAAPAPFGLNVPPINGTLGLPELEQLLQTGPQALLQTIRMMANRGADLFFGPGGMEMPPPPKDSPENAQKIIDGLEVVPVGLIRRLERVNPATGDVGAVGGDSGCAICWDRLLDGDGAEFGAAEKPADSVTSTSDSPASVPETRIISLPCSHVFHAACLVPWFSRPGQTTCPTCRFDVDPEGIIWYDGQKNAPMGFDTFLNFELPLFNMPIPPHQPTRALPIPENVIFNDIIPAAAPQNEGPDENDDDIPPLEPIPLAANPTAPAAPAPVPLAAAPQAPPPPAQGFVLDLIIGEMGPIPPPVDLAAATPLPAAQPAQQNPQPAPQAPQPAPHNPQAAPTNGTASNAPAPPPANAFFPMGGIFRGTFGAGFPGQVQQQPDIAQLFRGFGAPQNTPTPAPHNAPAAAPQNAPAAAPQIPQAATPGGQTWVEFMPFPGTDAEREAAERQLDAAFGGEMGNPFGAEMGNPFGAGFGQGQGNAPAPGAAGNMEEIPADRAGTQERTRRERVRGREAIQQAILSTNSWARCSCNWGRLRIYRCRGPRRPPPPRMELRLRIRLLLLPPPPAGTTRLGFTTTTLILNGVPTTLRPPGNVAPNVNTTAAPNPNANAAPANANGAPNANANAPPPAANPNPNAPQNRRQRGFRFDFPPQAAPGAPQFRFPLHPPQAHNHHGPPGDSAPHEPPQEWAPPPAPGPTLRDRVERRERETGLRCCDSSCGVGPSDDEPFIELDDAARRVVEIRPVRRDMPEGAVDKGAAVWCLVSAQRARGGWREPAADDEEVEVVCSVCRAIGRVDQSDWMQGCILPLD